MTRLALVLVIGLTLGAVVHLVTVMAIPRLAERDGWSRVMALAQDDGVTVIPPARPGEEALPVLDPAAAYAVCRFDVSDGPVAISAPLPQDFWSVSLFGSDRAVFYAVTREAAAAGATFDIELRNPEQARRFRSAQVAADPQTLHIETPTSSGFALFRAVVPSRSQRPGVEAALAATECGRLEETDETESDVPVAPFPRIRPQ